MGSGEFGGAVNDTVITQRGEGLFTEGRWRKQSIAEVLALYTHIKRHPSVGSCGEAKRSVEQENSHHVGHVCFIDKLPGLSTIPDRPDIRAIDCLRHLPSVNNPPPL